MRYLNSAVLTLVTIAVVYVWIDSRIGINSSHQPACKIGWVYDGDTVELKCGNQSVSARIIGYDAPETRDASCEAELIHGKRATQRLRALLDGGEVVAYRRVGKDKYDRPLITLWIDDVDVSDILIGEGLAVAYRGGKRINWCDRF